MSIASTASIHAWVNEHDVVNEMGRPIEFQSHFFLFDIMSDWSHRIRVKKGTQIGLSTVAVLKAGFATKHKRWNVIYTLPTDTAVSEFVQQKFDKIAKNNVDAFGKISIDNVTMKEIDGRFVTFKGTVSRTATLMSTADWLIRDETDRSDLTVLEGMESRVGASRPELGGFGGIMDLSNPSTPGIGIDKGYEDSDQKEFHIQCWGCKKKQALTFEDNVDKVHKTYICSRCEKELTNPERTLGEWIPANPGHKVSGYHISQLMAPWVSAEKVVDDFENKDPDYFYNFTLGLAFADSDSVVDKSLILDNWTAKPFAKPPYYLGVDIGKTKHYVLGTMEGITAVGRFQDWGDLDDLMRTYDPFCVMDAMPESTMADHYRAAYPGRLWTCYYNKDKAKGEIAKWGKDEDYGIVYADRSRLIGRTVREFLKGDVLVGIKGGPELKLYLKHIETIRKLKEQQDRLLTAIEKTLNVEPATQHVWTTISKEDHYAHATFYWNLARSAGASAEFAASSDSTRRGPIEETAPGVYKSRIKEMMEEDGKYAD